MEKVVYTVKEMQEVLGISRATAYELIHVKGFPAFRVGKKILISKTGLDEWISNGGINSIK